MALPSSRNRTYAADSPVRSADLNDLQDCIVDGKHGDRTLIFGAAAFNVQTAVANWATATVPQRDEGQWSFAAAAAGRIVAPVILPVGTRIRTVTWHFDKNSQAAALTMYLRKRTGTTTTDLSTTADVSSGANPTSVTVTPNYTMEALYQVWLEVFAGNANHVFLRAELVIDKL
jgi:hypothetical protein